MSPLRRKRPRFSVADNPPSPLLSERGEVEGWPQGDPLADISVLGQLAVNRHKVGQLEAWLEPGPEAQKVRREGGGLIALKGPPGSGRSTALREIATRRQWSIREWMSPVPSGSTLDCVLDFACFLVETQTTALAITREASVRWSIVVVDEIPVTAPNTAAYTELRRVWERLVMRARAAYQGQLAVPVVILTPTDPTQPMARFQDILDRGGVSVIEFRPVADGAMSKVLRAAVAAAAVNHRGSPGLSLPRGRVAEIVAESRGDLRSALSAVTLLATVHEHPSAASNACDWLAHRKYSNMDVFRTIGNVLYPKFKGDPVSARLLLPPEEILQVSQAESPNILGLLFANYLDHFQDLDDAVEAATNLSDADCLLRWSDDGLQRSIASECAVGSVAIRALMIKNRHRKKSEFRSLYGLNTTEGSSSPPSAIQDMAVKPVVGRRDSAEIRGFPALRALLGGSVIESDQVENEEVEEWSDDEGV
mmetsp:Transcript_3536/g.6692  ORF Transcript_3536/g.6692 Transcript_3536/m.6692 type:complete len:479 (-) Transcript_3536:1043-2479(-)